MEKAKASTDCSAGVSDDWTANDAISAVLQHVPHIFPLASSASDLVGSRILGGVSNWNFVVRMRDSEEMGVVVRLRQKGAAAGFIGEFQKYVGGGKSVEFEAFKAASAAKVGPELLHYERSGELVITREVNGKPLTQTELKSSTMLERVLPAFAKLHSLQVAEHAMPTPTLQTGYRILPTWHMNLQYVKDRGYSNLPRDLPAITRELERLDAFIASSSGGPHGGYSAVCHTDPVPANILACPDGSIVLVDFEYCSRAHPDYDIAKLAAAAMFSAEEDNELHRVWSRCGGGFGDDGFAGAAFSRFKAFKVFEIALRAMYCTIQVHESSLEFKASWSDATSWQEAADKLWTELGKKMSSDEMAMHRFNLARIRKCVIPVAGLASRIFPASKIVSKCFFPIYDPECGLVKPLIHHTLEKLVAAGIDQVCLVVNPADVANLRQYFDTPVDPRIYEGRGREAHAKAAADLKAMGERLTLVVQEEAAGFGDSIMRARNFINGEPFVVLHGDHVFLEDEGKPAFVAQLAEAFRHSQESTYGVGIEEEESLMYTASFTGKRVHSEGPPLFKAEGIFAYPITPEVARAQLRVEDLPDGKYMISFGAFVHMPSLFERLERLALSMPDARDAGGTVDAANKELIKEGKLSLAQISGQRLDIGTPLVYAATMSTLANMSRKRIKLN